MAQTIYDKNGNIVTSYSGATPITSTMQAGYDPAFGYSLTPTSTPTPTPAPTPSLAGNIPPAPAGTLPGANVDPLQAFNQQMVNAPPPGTAGAAPTPTSYTVQAGDTLGAIAGKLGVPVSQLTGYRSGNPNLIYPGEMISVKGADTTSKPVTLLTSSAGQDIATDNKTKLDAIQNVVNSFSGSANTPEQKAAFSSFSSSMRAEIDAATAQGGMTADERAGKQKLQDAQDALTPAAAKAQAALDAKDYTSMDYWTNKATADRQQYEKQLADYYDQTKVLRQRMTENATPSEKAQQLGQQLIDIRGQADAFKLQTEEDKFKEYEGQTLGFAGGRASEIDIRASFKNQEFALKEKNLLLSLGLEQDARKLEKESIETQLTWLADDFEVQQKIQDKITESEEKVFERADTLAKEQKDTLIKMLDGMKGINPDELSPETKKQLEDMAARAGIPFDLVETALQTQHNKQVFDETLKLAQEARLSDKSTDTTPKTEAERASAELQQYADVFVAGASYQGTPVIDSNGFITPVVWKAAIADASNRKTFIERFGYLLYAPDGVVDKSYGLTAQEMKLITG